MQATRRWATLALTVVLITAAAPAPYRYAPARDDKTIGRVTAPVTVIEYGSVACPHCADWDNDVFPAFKKKYIDTGKVRFVFRELLTGNPQLAAAGFVTARCVAPNHYFDVVHDIMRQQADIYRGGQLLPPLVAIAGKYGVNEAGLNTCLDDQKNLDAVSARSNLNAGLDNIDSTPSFVINGVKLEGGHSLVELDKAISSAAPVVRPAASTAAKPAPKKK
ncbi:MAG: disulfide bond formation protein DsbA [Caulobacteraceae bacterium]|nr:disulfide bond formation protein DsbA [Caulobacteraceae bacterium]